MTWMGDFVPRNTDNALVKSPRTSAPQWIDCVHDYHGRSPGHSCTWESKRMVINAIVRSDDLWSEPKDYPVRGEVES